MPLVIRSLQWAIDQVEKQLFSDAALARHLRKKAVVDVESFAETDLCFRHRFFSVESAVDEVIVIGCPLLETFCGQAGFDLTFIPGHRRPPPSRPATAASLA